MKVISCGNREGHHNTELKTQRHIIEQQNKLKKMWNTDPHQKPVMNSGAHEWKAVPASYKTPAVLLIYTVKSGKVLSLIEEIKRLHKK